MKGKSLSGVHIGQRVDLLYQRNGTDERQVSCGPFDAAARLSMDRAPMAAWAFWRGCPIAVVSRAPGWPTAGLWGQAQGWLAIPAESEWARRSESPDPPSIWSRDRFNWRMWRSSSAIIASIMR